MHSGRWGFHRCPATSAIEVSPFVVSIESLLTAGLVLIKSTLLMAPPRPSLLVFWKRRLPAFPHGRGNGPPQPSISHGSVGENECREYRGYFQVYSALIITQASGTDQSSAISTLKSVLAKIPLGGGFLQMGEGQALEAKSNAYRFDPKSVAPPEAQDRFWALLAWRDNVYRSVLKKIEAVPGPESLIDRMSEALNTCKSVSHLAFANEHTRLIDVYTILTPWLMVSAIPDHSSTNSF